MKGCYKMVWQCLTYLFMGDMRFLPSFFSRVKELEGNVVEIGNQLRSMTINEEKASKSQDSSSSKKATIEKELEEVSFSRSL